MFIYKITNLVTKKVYIGQTKKTISDRLQAHFSRAFYGKSKTFLHNSMRKNGRENFIIELIEPCQTQEELDAREKFWIRFYNSNISGYNITDGGRNGKTASENSYTKRFGKRMLSEESRKKISIANSGENNGMYGKSPLYKMSDDEKLLHNKRISNSLKISKKLKKSRKSKEYRDKISKLQSIPLYVLNEDFSILHEFENCRKIAEFYKYTTGNIKNARRDKRRIGRKYWLLYVKDYNENKNNLKGFFNV